MNYAISLSGQSYTLSTSDDAQIAAIAACRTKYNDTLSQTVKDGEEDVPNPALVATDAAYLEFVFGHWAAANPGFTDADLQAAAASAFASYAGQNPPAQIIEQVPLTGGALKAALKAYAAQKRYQVETGGMTVSGMAIPTDRITQSKLSGAVLAFQAGALSGSIDWKHQAAGSRSIRPRSRLWPPPSPCMSKPPSPSKNPSLTPLTQRPSPPSTRSTQQRGLKDAG